MWLSPDKTTALSVVDDVVYTDASSHLPLLDAESRSETCYQETVVLNFDVLAKDADVTDDGLL